MGKKVIGCFYVYISEINIIEMIFEGCFYDDFFIYIDEIEYVNY